MGRSFAEPLATWDVNLLGTLAVLEALRIAAPEVAALVVTSGEVYGAVPLDALPVGAETPLNPVSPYGASKAAADLATAQYRAAYGLPAFRVRAFNHIGPGQDPRFVLPNVARQIARAERDGLPEVEVRVGNVDTRRDFTDVRDMVRAYWLLLERGDPDAVYLACRGASTPVREIIEGLGALARIPVTFTSDAGLRREGEQPDLYGSPGAPAGGHGMDARDPDRDDAGRHARLVARAGEPGGGLTDHMPRALITGITGQDGSYLAELLLGKGYEVWGVVRRSSTESYERIEHLRDRLRFVQADLLDQPSLTAALQKAEPDEVYNLAAQSFVPTSWTQPVLTAEFTAVGVTRLLEAIRQVDPSHPLLPGVLQRDVRPGARDAPEREHALLPAQPLRRGQGLRPLHHGQLPRVVRPVRLLGDPLQPRVAAARPGVRHAQGHRRGGARIKLGLADTLTLGNLDARATGASPATTSTPCGGCSSRTSPEDYVVATGVTNTVGRLVELAFAHAGLDQDEHVRTDASLIRPAEVDLLVGDAAKARERLGWEPTVDLEHLVAMMVDADLERLSGPGGAPRG